MKIITTIRGYAPVNYGLNGPVQSAILHRRNCTKAELKKEMKDFWQRYAPGKKLRKSDLRGKIDLFHNMWEGRYEIERGLRKIRVTNTITVKAVEEPLLDYVVKMTCTGYIPAKAPLKTLVAMAIADEAWHAIDLDNDLPNITEIGKFIELSFNESMPKRLKDANECFESIPNKDRFMMLIGLTSCVEIEESK